jgi:hypothetical protein
VPRSIGPFRWVLGWKVRIECFLTLHPYGIIFPAVINTQPCFVVLREGNKAYKGRANSSDAALAGLLSRL